MKQTNIPSVIDNLDAAHRSMSTATACAATLDSSLTNAEGHLGLIPMSLEKDLKSNKTFMNHLNGAVAEVRAARTHQTEYLKYEGFESPDADAAWEKLAHACKKACDHIEHAKFELQVEA